MSRIGKLPVELADKVTAEVKGSTITVKGPKGTLTKTFDSAVAIKSENNSIKVSPVDESRHARAMYGTVRSIIAAMVSGVSKGFSKQLEISGTGFRATVKGKILDLALGYSHPVTQAIPDGVTVTVTDNTKINIEGIDKQVVGQLAASIKAYYPVEPYKAKGVRIVGEYVRRKEGKKTA